MKKSNLVRTTILAGTFLLQLSTLCFHSRGAAGDVDLSFDPGSGVNGTVHAVALQPDGKVIIGGGFTTVKGLSRTNVARLNADGSGDSSFNSSAAGLDYVYAVALQSDGKVLVGHYLGILRLNSDGSQDTNFIASIDPVCSEEEGCYRSVNSIAVQSDGKVLIGGVFSTVNGTNVSYGFARLNSNGSLDTGFDSSAREPGAVYSIVLQPDGKVLVGGGLTTDGTNYSYGLARLNANGSLDGSFNPGPGAPGGYVISVALQPDGKVLVGGNVPSGHGTNRIGAARLNTNGSLDSSFDPSVGLPGFVNSVALQPDGKVLVGGAFTAINGTNQNGLARYNADGSLDGSFNPNLGPDSEDYAVVKAIVAQSNGKVLIGGYFSAVNGANRNGIVRLNANGSLDGSFNPGTGVNGSVVSLLVQPDGKTLIGGDFTTVEDLSRYGLARLNADGSGDANFNPGIGFRDLKALQPDGKVLVASARLNADGSWDSSFHPDLGVIYNGYDYALATAVALQSDGKVLIGGYSVHFECDFEGCTLVSTIYFLKRLNANGSRDSNFNTGALADGLVRSIALQPDGKVLIGGSFTTVHNTNRNGIARLNADGGLDTSFNPGTGANGSVYSVALQPDGKVLIGGGFTTVNGTNRNRIARLNANGSLDNSLNPATGPNGNVASLVVQSDGKVLIGGSFTTVNGTNRNRIARLNADGSLDSSFNPGTGANGPVRSIALQSDGNVLIGGDFLTVNGVLRPHVARLYGDSVAPSLNIARSNAFVIVSWPVTGFNFQLQESTDLSIPNSWSLVSEPAVTNAGQISVTVPTTDGRKFFRLKSQ